MHALMGGTALGLQDASDCHGRCQTGCHLCPHLDGPWTCPHGRQPCDGTRLDRVADSSCWSWALTRLLWYDLPQSLEHMYA